MFEEVFRIIFDRRHVKDLRIWVVLMIAIGVFAYHKIIISPIKDRQDRQGLRIRQIIRVGKFREKIDALTPEETPRTGRSELF